MAIAVLAVASLGIISCGPGAQQGPATNGPAEPTGNAATVNGKAITMAEVERLAKQQAGDQWAKLSPLELAQTRLQVLQGMVQQEVMFQKADTEKTLPTDDEVTTAFNKLKNDSGKSAEDLQKEMEKQGVTEATIRDGIKKQLAIDKLIEKITGKVEPPKDSEIDGFFKGNPEAFVKKRGVKLAAIVIDPSNAGEGDKTTNETEAVAVANSILQQLRGGGDFAAIAREKSEDQSKAQGGDLGYISEEQLKQTFPGQVAATLMDARFPIGGTQPAQVQGKFYILKLQERNEKDENLTLESPGVRQQIADALTKNRKDLISQAYAAQAMNEAKVDNVLLKQIIENPNVLSGARPAVSPDANTNTNTNSNSAGNTNTANTNAKPAANTNAKPAANANANAASTNAANANK